MNVTPLGKLTGFVAIEKPSTKFDDNGIYSCQVGFTGASAKEMVKLIDEIMTENMKKNTKIKRMAAPPYTIEDDTLIVKFKNKAQITSRAGEVFEKCIKIFDAHNKPVTGPLFMGEGSEVRVAFKPYCWSVAALGNGCTLQLEMVQVVDLVKREPGSSDGNPFEAVEGYTAAKKNDNPFAEDKNDTEDDIHQEMVDKINASNYDF